MTNDSQEILSIISLVETFFPVARSVITFIFILAALIKSGSGTIDQEEYYHFIP